MPTLSLKRPPRFAPDDVFIVTTGFSLDLVDHGAPFCPAVGTTWRASHPGIAHMLKHGALGRFLVPATATEEELQSARMTASTFDAREAPDPFVRLVDPIPLADQRGCITPLSFWLGQAIVVINPGEIRDRHDEVVKQHPQSFEAIPAEETPHG